MYDAIKDGKAEDVLKSQEIEALVNSVKDLEKELNEKEEEFDNLKTKTDSDEKEEKKKSKE